MSEAKDPDFSKVKAIFFDLDDTLCAYWEAASIGLRTTFDKHPLPGISTDEMIGHWASAFRKFSKTIKASHWYQGYLESGEPTRIEQMRLTLEEAGNPNIELAKVLSQSYFEERDKALKLFPEALPVLHNLHGRFPLGLITNGPADIQNQEIDTLGIRHFFDHILIEGEMKEGKPLHAVFQRAESLVGVLPDQILFVGNSFNHDMRPAMAAGWKTAWVRRPSDVAPSAKDESPKPEQIPESGELPSAIISSLDEIVAWLPI